MLTHLRTILRSAAKSLGVERAAHAAAAEETWPEVVGPEAAMATRVVGLRAGVLLVDAQPGLWAQELSARRTQLAAALNQMLGDRAIHDIRIRQRVFVPARPKSAPREVDGPPADLSADEVASIDHATADMRDPELREVTRRAMASEARWRKRRAQDRGD